ncbi:hypothetical protein MSG28_011640 [Choristoneura fumiferana]|uniref:Uncharacterized protein n=1 Tax=Choristoneura fumiferana TaxID=7141 RepID=A0ACC0KL56_CHOFU|nr:hypothetical protein MSG28_011640 [Choristoneura fumiferana]
MGLNPVFVKIHSQRCADTQPGNYERGRHWFYDYKVVLSDDSTDSDTDTDSTDLRSSDDSESIDSLSLGK